VVRAGSVARPKERRAGQGENEKEPGAMKTLPLHEEIMLLVLRDREGTVEFGADYLHALGGAILAELLLQGRLRVEESGKHKLAQVADAAPVGDDVLDECLEKIATAKKPRRLEDWVARFANTKDLKHRVARALCDRGILKADEDTVLLIFTRKIYPEVDPQPEQAIIERLRLALLTDAAEIDARTAVLLSLAEGAGLLGFVFDKKEIKTRRDRLEAVINGELTGRATGDAIEAAAAMQAALMVAIMVPIITTAAIHN
jgi:Golgi phosphoprotein 3